MALGVTNRKEEIERTRKKKKKTPKERERKRERDSTNFGIKWHHATMLYSQPCLFDVNSTITPPLASFPAEYRLLGTGKTKPLDDR